MFKEWTDGLRRGLNRLSAAGILLVKRNTVTFGRFQGFAVVLKRRNPFGCFVAPLANFFFRRVKAPIAMTDVRKWQRREVTLFRRLNAPYTAWTAGARGVCQEQLPGESLWVHLRRGTLTRQMVEAAAAELRWAHRVWSEVEGGFWSHGDAAMCNIIYDPEDQRAYLIDFELMHNRELPANVRQADDLSVFLLDMVGYVPERKWLPYALAFLRRYDDPSIVAELRKGLRPPGGLRRLWWKIRTNFVDMGLISRRLTELQAVLDQGALARPRVRAGGGSRVLALQQSAML